MCPAYTDTSAQTTTCLASLSLSLQESDGVAGWCADVSSCWNARSSVAAEIPRALRVIEYFSKSLMFTQDHWIWQGALRMQDRKITDNEISGGGNAGQENDGQKCKAGKCKTGKWRTKVHGWKMQNWKVTEIKSAGVSAIRWHLVAWHDEMTLKPGTNTLMFCIWHCSHVRRVIPILFTQTASCRTTVTSAQSVGDTCVVCLMAPRDGVALVPCFHSRFFGACAATVATMDNGCPVCRTRIDMASVQLGLALNSPF